MTYKVERAIDHIWGYLEEELREKELLPKMRETSVWPQKSEEARNAATGKRWAEQAVRTHNAGCLEAMLEDLRQWEDGKGGLPTKHIYQGHVHVDIASGLLDLYRESVAGGVPYTADIAT